MRTGTNRQATTAADEDDDGGDPESRREHDRQRAAPAASAEQVRSSTITPPPTVDQRGTVPYGRYAGWPLRDLVRHDPDYLRWLLRHPSGRQSMPRLSACWSSATRRHPGIGAGFGQSERASPGPQPERPCGTPDIRPGGS